MFTHFKSFVPNDQEQKPRGKCYQLATQDNKPTLQNVVCICHHILWNNHVEDERSIEYDLQSYRIF